MHKEILNKDQKILLPLVKHFTDKEFYLAGGTALALQIGHRESVDFDMFSFDKFENMDIYKRIIELGFTRKDIEVLIDKLDEYTIFIKNTRITFLRYPFKVKNIKKEDGISFADKLSIGAMKAYALGRRGKWKDYVDLYILLREYDIRDITNMAEDIFSSVFSEKMFFQQLCYFDDVDFSEKVVWRIENPPTDAEVRKYLEKVVVDN
jgi:hypothetical protein